jgi:hypothetical protein
MTEEHMIAAVAAARREAREAALEEAEAAAYGMPDYAQHKPGGGVAKDAEGRYLPGSPFDRGAYEAAQRIARLRSKPEGGAK